MEGGGGMKRNPLKRKKFDKGNHDPCSSTHTHTHTHTQPVLSVCEAAVTYKLVVLVARSEELVLFVGAQERVVLPLLERARPRCRQSSQHRQNAPAFAIQPCTSPCEQERKKKCASVSSSSWEVRLQAKAKSKSNRMHWHAGGCETHPSRGGRAWQPAQQRRTLV